MNDEGAPALCIVLRLEEPPELAFVGRKTEADVWRFIAWIAARPLLFSALVAVLADLRGARDPNAWQDVFGDDDDPEA